MPHPVWFISKFRTSAPPYLRTAVQSGSSAGTTSTAADPSGA